MMKKITQILLVFFCLTAWNTLRVAAQDQIVSGNYYYVKLTLSANAANPNGRVRGMCVLNDRGYWDKLATADPAFIFRLESTGTDNEYYLYNLKENSWFSGVISKKMFSDNSKAKCAVFSTDAADRAALLFEPTSDAKTSFKIKPAVQDDAPSNPYFACYSSLPIYSSNYASDDENAIYHPLIQISGSNTWTVEKVSDADLRTANMVVALRTAGQLYNDKTIYTTAESNLLTDATTATDGVATTIKAGQFFSTDQQTSDGNSSFAHLIDNDYTASDAYYQAYQQYQSDATFSPKFLQVDVSAKDNSEDKVGGVQVKFWLRPGGKGAAGSPYDITIYGTNNAGIAEQTTNTGITNVAASSDWTKIGDYYLPTEQSFATSDKTGSTNTDNTARSETKVIVFPDNQGFRFLRFYVNNTAVNTCESHAFTLSELQLCELSDIGAVRGLDSEAYTTLKSLVKEYNATIQAINGGSTTASVSDDDLTKLQAAMNAVSKERNITIWDIGYSTFVSDVNVTLPEGLTAYYITANDGTTATLSPVVNAGEVLGAGVPVILKGDAGTYTLTVTTDDAKDIKETTNLLHGSANENLSQDESTTYYVLSKNSEGKAALMKYNKVNTKSGEANMLKAGYAYFTDDDITKTGSSPAFLNLSFADPTGIHSAVNAETGKAAKTYDLEGRSVKHPQKGIYIRDGKKVIIK